MLAMEKLQQPFSNMLSWILTELQDNQEDYISIVCKEGKEFRTSGLLLAAVSPFISDLLKSITDFQDCTIVLPDVEISCITVIFDRVLSFTSTQEQPLPGEWSKDPLADLFSSKSENRSINYIKEENDFDESIIPDTFCDTQQNDVGENYFNTCYNGIPNNKVLIRECRVDLERIGLPSYLITSKKDSRYTLERSQKISQGHKRRKIKMKSQETRENNIMKKIKTKLKSLNKVSDMNSSSDEEMSVYSSETNTKNQPVLKRNRRKNVRKSYESIAGMDSEDETDKESNYGGGNDSDFQVENFDNSDSEKEEEENKRDEKRRKVIYLKPEELPTDEKFVEYQEKIKQYCEDDCIDMAPEDYWRQIHGLTIYDLKKENIHDVIVCPICLSQAQVLSIYFNHLQVHKLKNFKCKCMPTSSPVTEKLRRVADQFSNIPKVVNGSFSEEFKTAVIDLYVNGCPYTKIARELGVSTAGLWNLVLNQSKEIKEKHVLMRAKVDKCEKDLKELKKMHVLKDHWKWIKCDKCQEYMDPTKMQKHLAIKHKQLEETQCEFCNEKFKQTNSFGFLLHMSRHKAEKFTCDCEIEFVSLKHKNHHMQSVHLKEFACCDQCNDVFKNMRSLETHKETHKREHSKNFKLNQKVVCDKCGKELGSSHSLKMHLETVHSQPTTRLEQCEKCAKQMNPQRLKYHKCYKKRIKKLCKFCGKQVSQLASHIRAMHLTHLLKFKCHQCERGFDNKRRLQIHKMNVHLKLRPYSCRYGCEFAYNDKSNRNHHEKKKHGGLYSSAQNKNEVKEDHSEL